MLPLEQEQHWESLAIREQELSQVPKTLDGSIPEENWLKSDSQGRSIVRLRNSVSAGSAFYVQNRISMRHSIINNKWSEYSTRYIIHRPEILESLDPMNPDQGLLARLRPQTDVFSYTQGFMGWDEKPEEIFSHDEKVLNALHLTNKDYSAAVRRIFATHNRLQLSSGLIACQEHIHSPECPFCDFITKTGNDPVTTEVAIINTGIEESDAKEVQKILLETKLNDILPVYQTGVQQDTFRVVSDIHAHLVEEHGFFEGFGTCYRLDPILTLYYLGIMPKCSKQDFFSLLKRGDYFKFGFKIQDF